MDVTDGVDVLVAVEVVGEGVFEAVGGNGVLVKVAVGVGDGAGNVWSAAAILTIPLPQIDGLQVLPPGKGLAVSCKIWRLWLKFNVGSSDSSKEMTPATWGAAMLVP